jgi:hypothetical protein
MTGDVEAVAQRLAMRHAEISAAGIRYDECYGVASRLLTRSRHLSTNPSSPSALAEITSSLWTSSLLFHFGLSDGQAVSDDATGHSPDCLR